MSGSSYGTTCQLTLLAALSELYRRRPRLFGSRLHSRPPFLRLSSCLTGAALLLRSRQEIRVSAYRVGTKASNTNDDVLVEVLH